MTETHLAVFKGRQIRRTLHNNEWWFSIVDVCEALTESPDAGAYWRKLKQRLKEEGSEVVTFCHGLKLPAADGKKYETDCANTEGVFRIIQSIPSPKAEPFKSGNVLLRREQYRRADDLQTSALIARAVLTGKIANCRTVLQRALRDHSEKIDAAAISEASQRLAHYLRRLTSELTLDIARGVEGESEHTYFSVFEHLITSQKDDFTFHERNRRPPLDNMNCLLSFLYALVMHDVRSALETVGLDPAVGFLHRDRPGRYGLALDLMEEFRPFIADRLALSLINLCQVQGKGFQKKESGAVWMDNDTRKTVLVAYQNRKQEEIMHPFLKEKVTIGLLFHVQALLMARYLRGDMDNYPSFIWK